MGSNAVATKVLTTAAYHGPVAGDSKLPSPWRWSLLGTVLALALLIVGLGLGFVVSATYFAVAAGGFVVGLVVLVIALIRAMRQRCGGRGTSAGATTGPRITCARWRTHGDPPRCLAGS